MGPRFSLFFGIMSIVAGVIGIITGKGGPVLSGAYLSGIVTTTAPVVDWFGWVMLPVGIIISILSIRALRRGEGEPKKLTDADLARAKKELDRMYFAEHGVWPKVHGSLLEEIDHKKDA
jgi:hypothetical protein